jgi:predicted alpha/beta-hydrolase family hydrolase
MPLLQRCIEAVVARTRAELQQPPLVLGGRSMGGRAASMLVASGFACQGLLLAAYPLHPAGKPQQLRSAHLPAITVPVLCLNGTRDALCDRELMDPIVASLSTNWTMHWLEGADHAFHVLRSSGRTDAQVLEEIGEAVERWLARIENSVSSRADRAASGS